MNHIALPSRPLRHPRTLRPVRSAVLLLSAACLTLLGACASTPAPKEQLAVSRAAVDRANGPAAAEAAAEASEARSKLDRANVAMANKDYVVARQLAEQAEADASLAEAKARARRSARALAEVQTSTRELREQTVRP